MFLFRSLMDNPAAFSTIFTFVTKFSHTFYLCCVIIVSVVE